MVTEPKGVQTDLSKVVHPSCRPTCQNRLSNQYKSPVSDQYSWDIDALNINCLGLIAYTYPSMALLHCDPENMAIHLPHHAKSPRLARDVLVLGPSASLNGGPTSTTSFNTSQTVPQPSVPQQSSTMGSPCLVSKSGLLQKQCFSYQLNNISISVNSGKAGALTLLDFLCSFRHYR